MIYQGHTLQFKPVSVDDLETIRQWRQSACVADYLFPIDKISPADQLNWYNKISSHNGTQVFVVEKLADQRPIGIVQLLNISWINKSAEWGFYMGEKSARLDGSGAETEFLIMRYFFQELKLNRLWCKTLSYNDKVISMHRKFGFVQEAILRQEYLIANKFVDTILMSILQPEFGSVFTKWDPYFRAWAAR